MSSLTNSDWQGLNDFLKALYSPLGLEQFPKAILANVSSLIPGELSELASFSADRKQPPSFCTFPDLKPDAMAEQATLERQSFLLNLLANYYLLTFDGQAIAISELWTEEFLDEQGVSYSDFLKSTDLQDQLAICFNLPDSLKVLSKVDPFHRGKEHLCLIINRQYQDFAERDGLVLNLIRPHLQQAYERLIALHQAHDYLSQQRLATDLAGLIALSEDGQVQWISQKARAMLDRYLPPSPTSPMAHTLPDFLQQWVNRHLAMVLQIEEAYNLVEPLKLQRGNQRLSIFLSYHPKAAQLYLLLEEFTQESFSITSLQLLGLTKREAEVLFWITKDKTLVELGNLLGISERTAKKHLENIYKKFGVQTRLSAVMYALEHLGIIS
ncbi:MAG: LuxR C-terminal-related transcriptional regulator [Leptolyngbya sp.]|nr:LuxR C-terminal-related transcriptional regulator [Leptolyngbya sp.]